MNGTHADICDCSLCQYERRLIRRAGAWKACARRYYGGFRSLVGYKSLYTEALGLIVAEQRRVDEWEKTAAQAVDDMNEAGLRGERLEAALRSIADYTQDGLNGECSLCYFKIEGLTTHKAECPWPAAVGAMRTTEP